MTIERKFDYLVESINVRIKDLSERAVYLNSQILKFEVNSWRRGYYEGSLDSIKHELNIEKTRLALIGKG